MKKPDCVGFVSTVTHVNDRRMTQRLQVGHILIPDQQYCLSIKPLFVRLTRAARSKIPAKKFTRRPI
jgi:hypothetical protein